MNVEKLLSLFLLLFLPVGVAFAGDRRSFVIDYRLAALRGGPDLRAPLLKRLRVGRAVLPVERRRDGEGRIWVRVAVTRRTRGWLLADSIAAPGNPGGERRALALLGEINGMDRAVLGHLLVKAFPRLKAAGRDAVAGVVAAELDRLEKRVNRRLGPLEGVPPLTVRALMLSDGMLDRFVKLGIVFDADPGTRRFQIISPKPRGSP